MPLLLGCRRAPAPELLVLHGLSQSTLEVGTELQLAGTGFPVHGEGRLIFDGTFHSPGREPRLAQSELPIAADAAGLLRHRLSEEDILRLSGGAQHSTFHGRLRVIFHSRSSFGPELAGGLADVTLDIFGETEKDSALPAEAELFSEFLGLELNDAWEVTV